MFPFGKKTKVLTVDKLGNDQLIREYSGLKEELEKLYAQKEKDKKEGIESQVLVDWIKLKQEKLDEIRQEASRRGIQLG